MRRGCYAAAMVDFKWRPPARLSGAIAAAMTGAATLLGGCLDSSVTFPVTREFSVSSSDFPVISGFEEEESPGVFIVPSIACSTAAECPTHPAIIVECQDSVCDPAPATAVIAMQEVDLTEVMDRFSVVETIALRGVEFDVIANSVNRDIPAVHIYWGAVGLTDVAGATHLGTFPAVPLGTTPFGEVELDAVGTAAMNDHLERVSNRFVIFLETTLDIEPGDRIPSGEFTANVQFEIRASGRVL